MKREKEISMADLWVMEINGKMEQVKKLYKMAELWLRGWNMKNMNCGAFHEREDYIQVEKKTKERGLVFHVLECG